MDPHSSRLQPDGSTFPPVTPDPPPPPGYVDPLEELGRAFAEGRGTPAEPDAAPDAAQDSAKDSAGTSRDEEAGN